MPPPVSSISTAALVVPSCSIASEETKNGRVGLQPIGDPLLGGCRRKLYPQGHLLSLPGPTSALVLGFHLRGACSTPTALGTVLATVRLVFLPAVIGDGVAPSPPTLLGRCPVTADAKEMAESSATGAWSTPVNPGWIRSDTNVCMSTGFIGSASPSLAQR